MQTRWIERLWLPVLLGVLAGFLFAEAVKGALLERVGLGALVAAVVTGAMYAAGWRYELWTRGEWDFFRARPHPPATGRTAGELPEEGDAAAGHDPLEPRDAERDQRGSA